jgi:hypothetical protein
VAASRHPQTLDHSLKLHLILGGANEAWQYLLVLLLVPLTVNGDEEQARAAATRARQH